MAFHSRRAKRSSRRPVRLATSLALVLGLVWTMAACGFDVQTTQPYTPADGVNLDVGTLKLRNMMVLSDTSGEGFLAGSVIDSQDEQMTAVSGVPVNSDGSLGSALEITLNEPITIPANQLVTITQLPRIPVLGEGLVPGLEAKLTMTFSRTGTVELIVPVVDKTYQAYETVSPTPYASATPSS